MRLMIFAHYFYMLLLLVLQQAKLLMLTYEIYKKPLCFFCVMQKKYFVLTDWILIFRFLTVGFSDLIMSLNLFPIANSMYGTLCEKQLFLIQSVELNFIICFFQSIIKLCIYSHLLPKIIVYISNFVR